MGVGGNRGWIVDAGQYLSENQIFIAVLQVTSFPQCVDVGSKHNRYDAL